MDAYLIFGLGFVLFQKLVVIVIGIESKWSERAGVMIEMPDCIVSLGISHTMI